jgi:hypothetical protein
MTTTLAPPHSSEQLTSPTHEDWPIGSTPSGGALIALRREARPESRLQDTYIERRRRSWLLDVERRDAVLNSGGAYLVCVGIVLVLTYFMAQLAVAWMYGPVN